MGTWGLIQIVIDIFLALGLFVVAMRISRQPKDDPRLSRGLQLLQAKIAVLEDLSDRTESQVQQMTSLLEQKGREVQNKIQLADRHVQLVRAAMDRSLEVAKIFQDKIPHQEIIERQNTLKYLQAARLAHQGKSAEEIAREVDLPKGEIEFISKVNRDQLMFSEDQLPDWARLNDPSLGLAGEGEESPPLIGAEEARLRAVEETARLSRLANQQELVESLQQVQREMNEMLKTESKPRDLSDVFSVPKPPTESLARLGEEFRKANMEAGGTGTAVDGSSFVELMPHAPLATDPSVAPVVPAAMDVMSDLAFVSGAHGSEEDDPLLDLSPEEIEDLKRSIHAEMAAEQERASAPPPSASSSMSFEMVEAAPPSASPLGSVGLVAPRAPAVATAPAPLASPSAATGVETDARARALAQARAAAQEIVKPQPVVRKVEFPRINVKPTDTGRR